MATIGVCVFGAATLVAASFILRKGKTAMKQSIKLSILIIAIAIIALSLFACVKDEHTHTIETISGKEATCTEAGLTDGKKCSVCGEIFVGQTEIPALGHTEEILNGKDATCTETGLTDGKKCSVCGEILVGQTEIPALGHTEGILNGKDATCTETGLTEGKKCSVCGEILVGQTEIPALGHKEELLNGKDATCAEDGLTDGKKCSVCGETVLEQEIIPALGHTEGPWIIDSAATCISTGERHKACTVCLETTIKEIIPLSTEHIWNEERQCTLCGILKESKGLLLELNSDKKSYSVIGIGECKEEWVIVPKEYNKLPIISISDSAFKDCVNITRITLQDSIIEIGKGAFSGCTSLKQITVPFVGNENLETKTSHFGYIFGADTFHLNASYIPVSLEKVVIIGGDFIASNAFRDCAGITNITIPASVKHIGSEAFSGCGAVIEDNGVIYVDKWAVDCGTSVTDVTLRDDTVGIANSAFADCTELSSISIPDTVSYIGASAFYCCGKLKNINIGVNISSIGSQAFYGCASLESITIPSSISKIEVGTFYDCINLKSIEISSSVTHIGDFAFSGCKSLTNVVVPDSVTVIGESAFIGCTGLTEITLPFVGSGTSSMSSKHFGYIFGAPTYSDNIEYVPKLLTKVVITSSSAIEANAFNECKYIEYIYIPESIERIGASAFISCESLEAVHIESLKSWCEIEFADIASNPLSGARNLYLNGELLEDLIIPDDTVAVSNWAFYMCESIKSITISRGVKTIGENAFNGCVNLTSVSIYDTLEVIGAQAFKDCTTLQTVIIPKSVKKIGAGVFRNCNNLSEITVPFVGESLDSTDNTHFGYIFGASFASNNKDFVPATLKTVVIENADRIYDYAFTGCSNIISISLPAEITAIGNYAFNDCASLESMKITIRVVSVGDYAFYGCAELSELEIAGGYISSIGEFAFAGCSKIESIVIPDSVKTIGYYAFFGCERLNSITIPFVGNSVDNEKNAHFDYIFGASSSSQNGSCVPKSLEKVVITLETVVADNAFNGCAYIKEITIPASVTSIGSNAFSGCEKLESVYISDLAAWSGIAFKNLGANPLRYASGLYLDGVLVEDAVIPNTASVISSWAFCGYKALKSVVIPNGVTSIGNEAFKNCTGLISVSIPESVESIGSGAFEGCSVLVNVNLPAVISVIKENTFMGCKELVVIVIPENVEKIASNAFKGCASLVNVVIPDSVVSIGASAFADCKSLESMTVPFVGAEIDKDTNSFFGYIFGAAASSVNGTYVPETLKTVVITGSTKLGRGAFEKCANIESITIPASMTKIGDLAFKGCTGLKTVNITDLAAWCGIDFGTGTDTNPLSYAHNLYLNNELVKQLLIPETVTKISNFAFKDCTSIINVVIPESVKEIGGGAFYACKSLKNVQMSNGVTSIGKSAFNECASLESINIPKSVTYISGYVFSGCPKLKTIIYNGSRSDWSKLEKDQYWNYDLHGYTVKCTDGVA